MKKIFLLLSFLASVAIINAQDTLTHYTGKYIFPEGAPVPEVEVVLEGDALSMVSSAGTSTLKKMSLDTFQIVEFNGTAVFKRGENRQVNAVHIEAMGYILDGQKQSTGLWAFTACYKPKNGEMVKRKK